MGMKLWKNDGLQQKTKEQGGQHVQHGRSCKLNQSTSTVRTYHSVFCGV
jgi:hypothetical protein